MNVELRTTATSPAPLALTIITSAQPDRLTKVLSLAPDGTLQKQAAANMHEGTARRVQVHGLHELAQTLDALTPDQAVCWGVCAQDEARIVPVHRVSPSGGAIARTREHFAYPAGPGIMMLDHDGTLGEPLDADALRQRLIDACPALAEAPMLWRPSVSAGVQAPDGRVLSGLTRHRLYIPVRDASRIPTAGKALFERLWAAGQGWYEVSRAGSALERSLIDAAVWQPERLDFCAPPVLLDGLTRPGAASVLHGDPLALFDLERITLDDKLRQRAAAAKRERREAVGAQCAAQRERWAAEKAPQLAQRRSIPLDKAHEVLTRASAQLVLTGDFQLMASDGTLVSVAEVLDRPDRWHNARFADPLDPDHDRRVAVVNLKSGSRPYLYSHRHGGMRFELIRPSARVQTGRGLRVATTDAVLAVLKARGELFDFGEGAIAYVSDGKARPASADWLLDHMGRVCEFYTLGKRRDKDGDEAPEERPDDAPLAVARAILAKHGDRGLPKLVAVVTAPTLRPDGSILDVPGHDEASGLLYYSEHPNPPRVPHAPTPDQALAALRELWQPLRLFPLVDDVDRGVVLQALLTAALRASLPTAPGIGLDATAAGSGKTLLGRCIGILATGDEPAILPPTDIDDETRKRLFAALLEGHRVVLWDNVREPLGNASLDAFLTAPVFADRVLGNSQTASLPNRAVFIATGNNLRLSSDTCRRVLLARLDTRMEMPYSREFNFCPAQRFAAHRPRYVIAALTIVRAYITAGRHKIGSGRTASFETWDDLVRQPLCWLATLVQEAGDADLPRIADPLLATTRAFEDDPETSQLAALLEAWNAAFGSVPTTVAYAVLRAETDQQLADVMEEIAGQSGRINTRSLGRWIERMAGRIVNGKSFVRGKLGSGLRRWQVCRARGPSPENTPNHTKPTDAAPVAAGSTPVLVGLVDSGGFSGAGATPDHGSEPPLPPLTEEDVEVF
jgi:hypothetical protein